MAIARSTTSLALWLTVALASGLGLALSSAYLYLSPQIPEAESYRHVKLRTPLRIYSSDGQLIQEFGERLTPVTFDEIPPLFIKALLDTEDKRFFEHGGIDLITVVNATYQFVVNRGAIMTGASTITMQLAKNISLSREERFIRKFREMLLALRIERELTKQEILELYLNAIPFGKHAFGIQAAANVYYGKDLSELNLAQLAMLAGIPKAPEMGNPINGPERALRRRDLVLRRMLEQRSITRQEHDLAVASPISASVHGRTIELDAPYVSEMVRQQLLADVKDASSPVHGTDIYTTGYEVFTTIDSRMQAVATAALRDQLLRYDRRHGYRRPERKALHGTDEYLAAPEYGYPQNWIDTLDASVVLGNQHPAIVIAVHEDGLTVIDKAQNEIAISLDAMRWARPYRTVNSRGPRPKRPSDVAEIGDLIRIEPLPDGGFGLGQVPDIQGALIALSPSDGAIRAMVGGYDFALRQYNHVLQARRQPGSNFKPFFYAGALENGLTAASIFNDAPLVLPGGEQEETYRPSNAGDKFLGQMRLREALYRSINLVSLRVLLEFGADNAVDYVQRFGFDTTDFPRDVQLALGGGTISVTPMEVVRGYAAFANGGFRVKPHVIARVETPQGEELYAAQPPTACADVDAEVMPENPAERVVDERVVYIMNSMLSDVIDKGTGRKAKRALKRKDIYGKTGTTNDADIWFSGFTKDLVATTWAGFDDNRPIGSREYGSTVPLETWIAFMSEVLPEEESPPPMKPEGLVSVRINPMSGLRASPTDPEAIFEVFREEYVPAEQTPLDHQETRDQQPTQVIF